MPDRKAKVILLGISFSVLVGLSCGPNNTLAGGTSIPNQIAGVIYSPQRIPAPGVTVTLLNDTALTSSSDTAIDRTISGADGSYLFTNVKRGAYGIVAVSPDSSWVSSRRDIRVGESDVTVRIADTLARGGSVSGAIGFHAAAPVWVQVYNTHFRATPDAAGKFTVSPLPPGTHTLLTLVQSNQSDVILAVHIDTASVSTGATTELDTVRSAPIGTPGAPKLIDDFEDGDAINAFGSSWWTFTDAGTGGNSTITPGSGENILRAISRPGAQASAVCAHVTYRCGNTGAIYAGFGCSVAPRFEKIFQSRDLSGLKRLNVWLRGSGGGLQVDLIPGIAGATNIILLGIPATPANWTRYSVSVDSLLAASDTTTRNNWKAGSSFIIQLDVIGGGAAGSQQEFSIDDVYFEF